MFSDARRSFLRHAAYGGTLIGASCVGLGTPLRAFSANDAYRWANLTPGFTLFMTEFIQATGLDKKYGLQLGKPTSYTSVSTYYNDFVAGNYDVCIGSWDTFASRYLAGVPLALVCGVSTASMIGLVARKGGVKDIRELAGRLVAAPQSTGTYRMARAVIKQLDGYDLEGGSKIQNVDNPAAAISMVMASRADAALTWEPNISAGMLRDTGLGMLYNVGDRYRQKVGVDLPYFGVAVRKSALKADPQLASRVDQVFAAASAAIAADPRRAVQIAGSKSGVPPEVLTLSIQSGRTGFSHISMSDSQGRQTMRVASDFLVRGGLLPKVIDDGFFA
ncbi:ABC transporter substrate-binding protein [Paraburkholderia fungorum]|uniref:ABC transporter substrate-binding protein n=1 Tax=Paraburkholderia fungorum TaxID=134537 RepID=UPI0038B86E04